MSEETAGERPWSETQWEAFMKRADARAARFGELLETVMDEPDKYETIYREMGWGGRREGEGEGGGEEPLSVEVPSEEELEDVDLGPEPEEVIPAYRAIEALGERTDAILCPMMEAGVGKGTDIEEDLSEAFIQVHIAAAKISGGHAMGYEEEVLCGNIVCNRIALEALGLCGEAWGRWWRGC